MITLAPARIEWVDYAKGFCIIMVVMMHSAIGVEHAAGQEGWLHAVTSFAKPFRMPDFFLISGLFLSRVIDRDWRTYLDRRVIHFAYFYVLWVAIELALKAPGIAAAGGGSAVLKTIALAAIEPFSSLWFIYLLAVFSVVTKVLRRVPPLAVFAVAAALEIAKIHTGWGAIDEFCGRFVYFYAGYWLATHFFAIAAAARANPKLAGVGLVVWAVVNGVGVMTGLAEAPILSLVFGFLGAAAVISGAALLSLAPGFGWLRYLGKNSIVVYLAFFLPMAASRMVLMKTGVITDVGTISLLVTLSAITGAVLWWWAVRGTRFKFLFERPAAFRLPERRVSGLQPAE